MKAKLLFVLAMGLTALTVTLYPRLHAAIPAPAQTSPAQAPAITARAAPRIDVVFVLDTTGSMGGLIAAAKEKIWSIATSMAQAQPTPEIRMGLVAYRDRGDQYVTRIIDLSSDLDSVYAELMDFEAAGGGDGPESVNQALYDAVHKMSWSAQQSAYQVVFLVGDAPPHMDYQDDVKYPETLRAAADRNIVVNTIQCGTDPTTLSVWQEIARSGAGEHFQVEQAGSAVAIATPFDERLAALSAELDDTRIYFGTAAERKEKARKLEATAKLHAEASEEIRARRAAFNASASGKSNLIGEDELVDAVASGRVDLKSLDQDLLPEPIRELSITEQNALLEKTSQRRAELEGEIAALAEERQGYLRSKVDELGGARDSLDYQIHATVRAQAEKKGLTYDSVDPDY